MRSSPVQPAGLLSVTLLLPVPAPAVDQASVFTPGLLGAEIVDARRPEKTLFTNVHVFDGTSERRTEHANVLVDGNPLEDITVIGGTDKWVDAEPEWKPIDTIRLNMLNGAVYKNTL